MCGCRKSPKAPARAVVAAATVYHAVFEADGTYTGRRYANPTQARQFADAVPGRTIRPQTRASR